MGAFEYLSVLISIILALGMTRVLAGVGEMLQARSRRHIYWVHAIWIVNLFLYLVIAWWIFCRRSFEIPGVNHSDSLFFGPRVSHVFATQVESSFLVTIWSVCNEYDHRKAHDLSRHNTRQFSNENMQRHLLEP
jgi:hypothetical protein